MRLVERPPHNLKNAYLSAWDQKYWGRILKVSQVSICPCCCWWGIWQTWESRSTGAVAGGGPGFKTLGQEPPLGQSHPHMTNVHWTWEGRSGFDPTLPEYGVRLDWAPSLFVRWHGFQEPWGGGQLLGGGLCPSPDSRTGGKNCPGSLPHPWGHLAQYIFSWITEKYVYTKHCPQSLKAEMNCFWVAPTFSEAASEDPEPQQGTFLSTKIIFVFFFLVLLLLVFIGPNGKLIGFYYF